MIGASDLSANRSPTLTPTQIRTIDATSVAMACAMGLANSSLTAAHKPPLRISPAMTLLQTGSCQMALKLSCISLPSFLSEKSLAFFVVHVKLRKRELSCCPVSFKHSVREKLKL